MANAFDTEATPDTGGGGPPPAAPAGEPPGGGAPGGPPPGGGPMIAALARNAQQPPVSSPGMGNMAGAMNQIHIALQSIHQAMAGLPPGSPLYKDAVDSLKRLSRHLPQGAPMEGVQQTGLRDLLRQALQSGFLGRIMQQLQGQMGQRGQGAETGAGPSPNLAMQGTPSTPIPGA